MAITSFRSDEAAKVPLAVIGVFLLLVSVMLSINILRMDVRIANPFILDEQYPGSTPSQTTGAAQPQPTGASSEPQQAPFLTAAGALAVMLAVWMWKRKGTY